MKTITRILLFPAALLLKVTAFILLGAAKLSALLTGPLITFMIGCGIYSLWTSNWKQALILAAASAIVYLLYLAAGVVIAALYRAGDALLL